MALEDFFISRQRIIQAPLESSQDGCFKSNRLLKVLPFPSPPLAPAFLRVFFLLLLNFGEVEGQCFLWVLWSFLNHGTD